MAYKRYKLKGLQFSLEVITVVKTVMIKIQCFVTAQFSRWHCSITMQDVIGHSCSSNVQE